MDALAELGDLIARHVDGDGIFASALPRVTLIRSSTLTEPIHTVYEPSLCLVAQGSKRAIVGTRSYRYHAAQYVVVSVDLPVIGAVVEASAERPYLCLSLGLNLPMLSELLIEQGGAAVAGDDGDDAGLGMAAQDPDLLDAAVRLLRLLDRPRDAAVLAPLAEREILYRLLTGGQSALVRRIATADSRLRQIGRAIGWIKRHYAGPFSIAAVAAEAGMSASSFHQHFKAVTAMSPLQYRTRLRLHEARRLLVEEGIDAASAGFRVGYESPSQFSRDYARCFGAPPYRDAGRLRATPALGAALVA